MGQCLTFRSQVQPADFAMLRQHVPQLLWLLQAEELHWLRGYQAKGYRIFYFYAPGIRHTSGS